MLRPEPFPKQNIATGHHRLRLGAALVALALLAVACGGSDGDRATNSDPSGGSAGAGNESAGQAFPVDIPNQGGDLEGHTPRSFAGSGTGLFAGDNLNPGFPDDAGIQILLTFELPDGVDGLSSAELVSEVMTVRGDPFETMGPLVAEPVVYDEFGPPLFDLAAAGPAVGCERIGTTGISCDVTAAAQAVVADGADRLQLRLQFEREFDGDGEQDLALFFLTDSNTNEAGIFRLRLS